MIQGLPEMIRKLEKIKNTCPDNAERILGRIADEILKSAKERTPVVTGKLRNSGKRGPVTYHGKEMLVEIQFGGESAPYAIYVHENLRAIHPNGQAKFLESAIVEHEAFVRDQITYSLAEIWTKL